MNTLIRDVSVKLLHLGTPTFSILSVSTHLLRYHMGMRQLVKMGDLEETNRRKGCEAAPRGHAHLLHSQCEFLNFLANSYNKATSNKRKKRLKSVEKEGVGSLLPCLSVNIAPSRVRLLR